MTLERKSIVAGFLIGLGVIINTLASSPVLGSFLFSFGLLTIIDLQLPLFTGQIGFIAQRDKMDLIRIFVFNCLGILICAAAMQLEPAFIISITEKGILKFQKSFFQLFFNGFICGTLIHFAVKNKKPYTTIMAVMIFILAGAEHCIADFFYYLFIYKIFPSAINLIKFFAIVMGNSCGAIFIENLLKQKGKK